MPLRPEDILAELRPLGLDSYRRVIEKHGVREPVFGVKVEELKKIQKRIKIDYQLALDLYATGIYDAQYLAGLIADDQRMSMEDLQAWALTANSAPISENTVAWVAAEGRFGWPVALQWIESEDEKVASAGWSTLGSLVSIKPDEQLDLAALRGLIGRVVETIHAQPNRARYCMNGFLLCTGAYMQGMKDEVIAASEKMGKVTVDVGDTACKVPLIRDYLAKIETRGAIGKKRKTAKC